MKENGSSVDTNEPKPRRKSSSASNAAADREFGSSSRGEGSKDGSKIDAAAADIEEAASDVRERLSEASRSIRDDADKLAHSLGGAAQEVGSYLKKQLEERPYATIGAAAGLGYVLGGGLTLKVVSLLVGTGGRLFASAVLREVVSPTTVQ